MKNPTMTPDRNRKPRAYPRAFAIGLVAALAAAPGHSVEVPDMPLQTGSAYPPANVMFILDDSGSMVFEEMPDDESSLEDEIDDKSYVHNTIYYNPAVDYLPWMTADGTRMAGGTSYTAAYADLSLASGSTVNLGNAGSCDWVYRNGSPHQVCGGVQTFFVPKQAGTTSTDEEDYYRYQIRTVAGTGPHVVRSEYLQGGDDGVQWNNRDIGRGESRVDSFQIPSGTTELVISIRNGSGGNAELYVRRNATPTTSEYDYRDTGSGNNHSVTIDAPEPGTWYILTYNASNSNRVNNEDIRATWEVGADEGVDGAGCTDDDGGGWRNCTFATPTGRSEAAELGNFATWFSYHRTRLKVAKAGASEAFGQLGSGIRVGYDSIWARDSTVANYFTGSVSTSANPAFPIPVGTDGGLFLDTNRERWFEQLHEAHGYNGTPLKGALQRSGRYFENTSASGPWGPGTDQFSCRQNFAILTTDGYWNSDAGFTSVGDADATQGALIVSEDATSSHQYRPVSPYADNFSGSPSTRGNTLADVANYYWKRDLVPLANDVPTSVADPAFWQHMVTFGVSIGLKGRLDPKTDLQAITNGSKRWGDPTDAEDLDRIDDLWHASVNGHGNFVSATRPEEFVQGLVDALATVAQRLGSASNVTANSTSFQTDTRVYQASYVSGKWTGELAAYEVSAAGVSTKDEDGDGVPDAAWKASALIPAYGNRIIFTSTGSGAGNGTAFPTAGQVAALALPGRGAGNGGPVTGAQNAAYVAGARDLEIRQGGTLRDRDTVLGDIANSSPMYVQDNEMIYVGANDGMLHAFSAVDRGGSGADGGEEMFAYVPAGIDFDDLATLSDTQYANAHRYFVDGPVVVSPRSQTSGTNYLIATLGRGGKGLFVLDVTDPEDFDEDDVLWDLTGTALGADMGHVLGEPLVVRLDDGSDTEAVLVGNGINSVNGKAVLFLLDLDTGAVIRTFDTGVGGDNGLSAPRGADLDGDGRVDVAYAGDLRGNVWKFDLSGDPADWEIANGGVPLFTATDAGGTPQPITAGLALARDPGTGKIWVFAGTGQFIESADVGSTAVQSMYGLIDDDVPITGRGELVERGIVVTGTSNGRSVRGFAAAAAMPLDKKGWFIDLDVPAPGERVVSNPRVRGTVLLFASMIPPAENTCDAGGTGYVNALDAFTGTSLGNPYFDVNNDGQYDDEDGLAAGDGVVPVGSVDLGVGMPTLPSLIESLLVVGGSSGTLGSITMNPQGGAARRISWREILRD